MYIYVYYTHVLQTYTQAKPNCKPSMRRLEPFNIKTAISTRLL